MCANDAFCVLNGSVPLPCTGGEVGSKSEPAAAVAPAVIVDVKEEEKSVGNGGGGGGAKKRRGGGAPAVLMEGSRCSRVNGRGWRCSQPTLVGYALCEHHLGKGRMRSVTGGGGDAAAPASSAAPSTGRRRRREPAAAAAPPRPTSQARIISRTINATQRIPSYLGVHILAAGAVNSCRIFAVAFSTVGRW